MEQGIIKEIKAEEDVRRERIHIDDLKKMLKEALGEYIAEGVVTQIEKTIREVHVSTVNQIDIENLSNSLLLIQIGTKETPPTSQRVLDARNSIVYLLNKAGVQDCYMYIHTPDFKLSILPMEEFIKLLKKSGITLDKLKESGLE